MDTTRGGRCGVPSGIWLIEARVLLNTLQGTDSFLQQGFVSECQSCRGQETLESKAKLEKR